MRSAAGELWTGWGVTAAGRSTSTATGTATAYSPRRPAPRASCTASPRRAGTPATSLSTPAATMASSAPAARSRCATGIAATCRSPTPWWSTSPSGSASSAPRWPRTYPNRRFFFTGTASGTIATDTTTFNVPVANGTIWDRLDAHRIDWGIYYQNVPSWVIVPGSAKPARARRVRRYERFAADVAAGRLPQFTFLDPQFTTTSEENPQDIQVGERYVAAVVRTLMHAPPGGTRRCSSPMTCTAATTTTCRRRERCPRRHRAAAVTCRRAMTVSGSACR